MVSIIVVVFVGVVKFSFRKGDYGTSFIAEQYPHGFHGVPLTAVETLRLVASSAVLHQARMDVSLSSQEKYEEGEASKEYVILLPACVSEAHADKNNKKDNSSNSSNKKEGKERAYRVKLYNDGQNAAADITLLGPHPHPVQVHCLYVCIYVYIYIVCMCM